MRPLVVVTDSVAEPGAETRVLHDIADVRLLQAHDEAEVAREAKQADVLLVYHTIALTGASIEALEKCRGLIRCGVGYDNVDLQAAGRLGIVVCNVPDYGAEEVADHALMMLLAVARRLVPAHDALRRGQWDTSVVYGAPRFRGRTLGLIGCGRIGTATALRAKALGVRVLAYDPYRPDGLDKALGIERCYRLEELLPQSEFLSIPCPLNRETRHIINDQTLSLLPRGAYLVNTARGPCVDPAALLRALDSGQVAAAGLDVFENEPLDNEALRCHPRVLLTPHAAFYSVESYQEMRTKGAQEARRILQDEPVRNPVNLHCLVNPRCVLPRLHPPVG